jgi:hypothetical protein
MKLNQLKIKTLISTELITLMPKEVLSQINRILESFPDSIRI